MPVQAYYISLGKDDDRVFFSKNPTDLATIAEFFSTENLLPNMIHEADDPKEQARRAIGICDLFSEKELDLVIHTKNNLVTFIECGFAEEAGALIKKVPDLSQGTALLQNGAAVALLQEGGEDVFYRIMRALPVYMRREVVENKGFARAIKKSEGLNLKNIVEKVRKGWVPPQPVKIPYSLDAPVHPNEFGRRKGVCFAHQAAYRGEKPKALSR